MKVRRMLGDSTIISTDGVSQLLTEDVILPSQFADSRGQGNELSPCQHLRFATLANAVDDLRRTANVKSYLVGHISTSHSNESRQSMVAALRAETIAWFESDDTEWPFSFRAICDGLLDVDADALLRGLRGCDWNPPAAVDQWYVHGPSRKITAGGRKTPTRSGAYYRRQRKINAVPSDFHTGGESTEALVNAATLGDAA